MLNYVPNFWQRYWWRKIITSGGSGEKMAQGLAASVGRKHLEAWCFLRKGSDKLLLCSKPLPSLALMQRKLSVSCQARCHLSSKQRGGSLVQRGSRVWITEGWGLIRFSNFPFRAFYFPQPPECFLSTNISRVAYGLCYGMKLIHGLKLNY